MGLIELIIALIIVGAVLYIVNLLPIHDTIKRIIQVICILFVCIWLLRTLGHMAGPFWR